MATTRPLTATPVLTQAPAPQYFEQRRVVRGYILFTILILLTLALAWRLREVLELIYVSGLFAVVLMPVVKRIEAAQIGRYKPSRFAAIAALMLSVLLVLFLLLFFGLPPVLRDLERFASDLPQRLPALVARAKRIPLLNEIGLDSIAKRGEAFAASFASFVVSAAPKWLGHIFDLATGADPVHLLYAGRRIGLLLLPRDGPDPGTEPPLQSTAGR